MLFKSLLIVSFLIVNVSLSYSQGVRTMALDEFITQYNKSPKKTLLDVRTPEEWAKGKISSSKCINIKEANFLSEINKLDKNIPIFVFCAAGVRSASATKKLQEAGFKSVYNLTNAGYADLAAKGLK